MYTNVKTINLATHAEGVKYHSCAIKIHHVSTSTKCNTIFGHAALTDRATAGYDVKLLPPSSKARQLYSSIATPADSVDISTKPAPGYDTGEGRQSEYNILFMIVSVKPANYLNCYKTGHHTMASQRNNTSL